MTNPIHPLVLATLKDLCAKRELELERLRSARNSCTTVSPGGQSRAMALGKKIREVESILSGWRLVIAVTDDDPRGEACSYDCDHCHDGDCPCPRQGCAGGPETADLIQAAKRGVGSDRFVAYRGHTEPVLHCPKCVNPGWQSWTPLTSGDLPDGGVCGYCHVDVIA